MHQHLSSTDILHLFKARRHDTLDKWPNGYQHKGFLQTSFLFFTQEKLMYCFETSIKHYIKLLIDAIDL